MSNEVVIESTQAALEVRANEVRTTLLYLKNNIEGNHLDLYDLLKEAHENSYHRIYGYNRFGDWITAASGLGISPRSALYMVNIAKKSQALGVSRAQLVAAGVSNVKEILSLNLAEHTAEMRDLITEAPTLSLDEVRNRVRLLKGQEESVFINLRLDKSVKAVLDEALELARRNYGSVVTEGEATDISDSKAVEMIAISYTQDPNNQGDPEDVEEERYEEEV